MSHRTKVDKGGRVRRLSATGGSRVPSRYRAEMQDGKLVIRPMTDEERQAHAAMTPEEKAKKFLAWANQPRPETPILPDEAFSRENLYD